MVHKQISIFDDLDPVGSSDNWTWEMDQIDKEIKHCIAYRSDRAKLVEVAIGSNYDQDQIAAELKRQHGTGGHTVDHGFVDYDCSGITITDDNIIYDEPDKGRYNVRKKTRWSWTKVAKRVIELIKSGEFYD